MSVVNYLVDTNILIYHTNGSPATVDFLDNLISDQTFNISILTKIEFLGWDKHTPGGFEKCKQLIECAKIYTLDESVVDKTIKLKRETNIKLGDAVIAATALLNSLTLVTRNIDDFKNIKGLKILNPFEQR